MTYRLEKMGQENYTGLTVLNPKGDRHFNGRVLCHDDKLTIPLGWRKPRRIFVNSMSDLFHERVPFEFIDRVFAVMALCPQHTFQQLTKRPERAAEYHASNPLDRVAALIHSDLEAHLIWPLPNVWLGTSVEDQARADERIPWLLKCPAKVRFLSCEPLLAPISFGDVPLECNHDEGFAEPDTNAWVCAKCEEMSGMDGIDWVIVGGESGGGARACDMALIRSIVEQCRAAKVAVFVKQLGKRPILGDVSDPQGWPTKDGPVNWETGEIRLKDSKGGEMSEWPEDLRVREMPR